MRAEVIAILKSIKLRFMSSNLNLNLAREPCSDPALGFHPVVVVDFADVAGAVVVEEDDDDVGGGEVVGSWRRPWKAEPQE